MASVRKRKWQSHGETKEAWVADYFDQAGQRHIKTFERKKEAEAWLDGAKAEVRTGTHTADSTSKTVAEAGDAWIAEAEADGLERSTVKQYREHLDRHIKAHFPGETKLSRLTAPMVHDFRKKLRKAGRSPAMVDKIVTSLGAIVSYALDHGLVAKNVVRDARPRRRRGQEKREKKAVEIPTKAEIQAMLAAAQGWFRPFLVTALFTGLRSSELRGLTWGAVDLEKGTLTVSQRMDAWNEVGAPKSGAGNRTIPLAPMVMNALKEWKLKCPRRKKDKKDKDDPGELWLVFPNGAGKPESHGNIINRHYWPLQMACGVVRQKGGSRRPKYGLHALRHVAASLFIEQGMTPKRVQDLMGHSSIKMTFDVYGHLFPAPEDDRKAMEQIQARLLAR